MPSRARAWTLRYLRLCGVALPFLLLLAARGPTVHEPAVARPSTPSMRRGRQLLRARDIFGKKERSRHLPKAERRDGPARADATPENLRLLYAIMAYDRKQHIHLLTMPSTPSTRRLLDGVGSRGAAANCCARATSSARRRRSGGRDRDEANRDICRPSRRSGAAVPWFEPTRRRRTCGCSTPSWRMIASSTSTC